jgi:nucleoid DNA-binding protein
MRQLQWGALGALVGTLGLVLGLASPARSQRPQPGQPAQPARPNQPTQPKEKETLKGSLLKSTQLPERHVDKLLAALGPAIRDQLAAGNQVEVPGLGVFRVVRVPQHRDLVGGRPATIPGSNNIEFLPAGTLVNAANGPGAVPAVTVPPFEFNPLPQQTPGQKVGNTRTPSSRIR